MKKMVKFCAVLLIMAGLVLTISNFSPSLMAAKPAIWGTRTEVNSSNQVHYVEKYGLEGLYARRISAELYCVDYACDCVIVYG